MAYASLRGSSAVAPAGRPAARAAVRTARPCRGPPPPAAGGWLGDLADAAAATSLPTAVAGIGALAAVGVGLLVTDPERRRAAQAAETGGNEKEAVKAYFNNVGFDRWSRIYSESDDVNSVQRDIREGHAQTVDKVLGWLADAPLAGVSVCDAGCGTGSLAIPLAFKGAAVTATDISAAMAEEAARRYEAEASAPGAPARPATAPVFAASSLDELTGGPWDVVTCIDVLIHYPQADVDAMLTSLVGKATKKVVLSFAPSTPYYEVLKRVGELFPKGAKATRAYLHTEQDVEAALNRAGWKVTRKEMTATKFYFSRLFEAVPM